MSAGTLDDRYLTWLYGRVAIVKSRRKTADSYWNLLRQLYATEFVWLVPNDDNRAADGLELRQEWLADSGVRADPEWVDLPCSFLEMLIGLARRIEFESENEADASLWFWHLLDNVDLLSFNDKSDYNAQEVEDRIRAVLMRTYHRSGAGGLFPLQRGRKDQRRVEIWYQLSAYLLQNTQ